MEFIGMQLHLLLTAFGTTDVYELLAVAIEFFIIALAINLFIFTLFIGFAQYLAKEDKNVP